MEMGDLAVVPGSAYDHFTPAEVGLVHAKSSFSDVLLLCVYMTVIPEYPGGFAIAYEMLYELCA